MLYLGSDGTRGETVLPGQERASALAVTLPGGSESPGGRGGQDTASARDVALKCCRRKEVS